MKKILVVLILSIMFVGCSSTATKETICKGKTNDTDITYTIKSKGKKVNKITVKFTTSTVDLSDADVEASVKQMKAVYKDIKGISIEDATKDKMLTITISVDITKADTKDLQKLGFTTTTGDIDYIELEGTLKNIEANKISCK